MSDSPPYSSVVNQNGGASEARPPGAFVQRALGAMVSLVALAIIGFSVDWSKVGQAITTMHLWAVVPGVFLIALQMIVRGLRWRYLLPKDDAVSLRKLVDAIMVGNLATSLLPLRAGEFIRPLLLSLQTSYSFPVGFVSVVIERFFDLSAVLISFGIVVMMVKGVPTWVVQGASALSVLAIALLIFIIIGALFREQVRRFSFACLSVFPQKLREPLEKFVVDLLEGARALGNLRNLSWVIIYTIAVWAATFASYYVFFWLFDIPGTFMHAVIVAVFIALAVAAPSAPGFIGVYQIGCVAAFSLISIDIEVATAYALMSHLIQYLSTIVYGGYALSRTEWSLADLMRRKARGQS